MSMTLNKVIIPKSTPRNPLVVPAIKRKAGKHKDKKRKDKNEHKE